MIWKMIDDLMVTETDSRMRIEYLANISYRGPVKVPVVLIVEEEGNQSDGDLGGY